MAAAATTSPRSASASPPRPSSGAGPDRITVLLVTLTVFLVILAGLAWQVRSAPRPPAHRVVVVRRVYETRVVETVVGASGGSSVTQSVSSSGSASALPAAATTRTS
jgi:hypothetical protein